MWPWMIASTARREDGGEAGGGQQGVAVAQWHLQLFGEVQHHVPAGLGAAGFKEAEMARGDFAHAGEVELADTAPLAPLAQQRSELC
jgi:hypothetical protein